MNVGLILVVNEQSQNKVQFGAEKDQAVFGPNKDQIQRIKLHHPPDQVHVIAK